MSFTEFKKINYSDPTTELDKVVNFEGYWKGHAKLCFNNKYSALKNKLSSLDNAITNANNVVKLLEDAQTFHATYLETFPPNNLYSWPAGTAEYTQNSQKRNQAENARDEKIKEAREALNNISL